MMENKRSTITGLNEEEAREYHSFFVSSTIGYIVIAIIAHFLVWQWRPWFPGPEGYGMTIDAVNGVVSSLKSAFV